jgi:hypothetical protein
LNFATAEESQNFYALVNKDAGYLRIGRYKDKPRLIHIDVGYLIFPKASTAWVRGARWEI